MVIDILEDETDTNNTKTNSMTNSYSLKQSNHQPSTTKSINDASTTGGADSNASMASESESKSRGGNNNRPQFNFKLKKRKSKKKH